jgi:hypothetical protein
MDRQKNDWQDTETVLRLFGKKESAARRQYRHFVEKGIALGKRDDLIGGGLIRSHGGWANVKAMRRAKIFEKADERILGDGDFVQEVLDKAEEKLKHQYLLKAKGVNLDRAAEQVSLCYLANRELGISMAELSRRMNVSVMAVSYSVQRGEKIVKDLKVSLL